MLHTLDEQLYKNTRCESISSYMNQGWTALHHAAAGGHAECVKALGEAGERALVDLRTWEVCFVMDALE